MTDALDALLSPVRPASSAHDKSGVATMKGSGGSTLTPMSDVYTARTRAGHAYTSSSANGAGPSVHSPSSATFDAFAGRRRFTTLEKLWDTKAAVQHAPTKTPLPSKLSVSPAAISERLQRLREASPLTCSRSNLSNVDFTIAAAHGLLKTPLSSQKLNASNVSSFVPLKKAEVCLYAS